MAGVIDPVYSLGKESETYLEQTGSAKSFRCVGKDFRAAL
jgi:hypothetical protein